MQRNIVQNDYKYLTLSPKSKIYFSFCKSFYKYIETILTDSGRNKTILNNFEKLLSEQNNILTLVEIFCQTNSIYKLLAPNNVAAFQKKKALTIFDISIYISSEYCFDIEF